MKLTVKTGALIRTLNEAIDAIPSASAEPSYRNFLFTVADDRLEVLASDGNVTLKTTLPAKEGETVNILATEPGQVQIPAHFLLEIVRKLEGETVTLQTADTSLMTVSDERTFYKVNTLDAADYPDVDMTMDEATALHISYEDFVKLYNSTAFAVATKATKQCYMGINIRTADGRLYFLATDGCRLAQYSVPLTVTQDINLTVAVKVLGMVAKKEGAKEVEFQQDASKALFRVGHTLLQSRLYGGDFPSMERVFPKVTPYLLTVNSSEFLDALDRVTIVTLGANAPVAELRCSAESCELVASSDTYGDAKESLKDFAYEGDVFAIHFNTKFVAEAVKALAAPKVTLGFAGESKIFVVKSDDVANNQVLTPIRVNS